MSISFVQLEHQKIRSMKKKDEFLNWDDYKDMEFTQNVRFYNFHFIKRVELYYKRKKALYMRRRQCKF